jgi:NAD(P)H-hydrate epimerase
LPAANNFVNALIPFVGIDSAMRCSMKVASVAEMRAMDRQAMEQFFIPAEILMENAGLAACAVLSRVREIRGLTCAVLCGPGNNGGDGLVLARLLHSRGALVTVFLAGEENKFQGAAAGNLKIIRRLSLQVRQVQSAAAIRDELTQSGVLLDALLGTGLDREVSGLYRDLIELMNASGKTILSLDIPSGINGDTGAVMGAAVRADYTVAFGLPKIGNLLYPGFGQCGRLSVSHISFPPALYDDVNLNIQINDSIKLPSRPSEAHKGSMGKALFIAGAANYYGAPYFSSLSFLKAGGGYAYLATPCSVAPFVAQKGSEIVILPQQETASGSIAPANLQQLLEQAEKSDLVVLGPGLSLATETKQLVKELVAAIRKPLLLDGDGLTAVAGDLALLRERPGATILTPHLGELASLTGKTLTQISDNRIIALQEASREAGALVVMKGPHSLIGAPDGKVFINLSGNPGMATAGAGDALTGTIAAMFGLGLPLEEAVRKGVFIHGLAGDLAAAAQGEDGVTATDILEFLPLAMKQDREGGGFDKSYAIPVV